MLDDGGLVVCDIFTVFKTESTLTALNAARVIRKPEPA